MTILQSVRAGGGRKVKGRRVVVDETSDVSGLTENWRLSSSTASVVERDLTASTTRDRAVSTARGAANGGGLDGSSIRGRSTQASVSIEEEGSG